MVIESGNKSLYAEYYYTGKGTVYFHVCGLFHNHWKIGWIDEYFMPKFPKESDLINICNKNEYELVVGRPQDYNTPPAVRPKVSNDCESNSYNINIIIRLPILDMGSIFYKNNKDLPVVKYIMEYLYKIIDMCFAKHEVYSLSFAIKLGSIIVNDSWDSEDGRITFESIGMASLRNIKECCGMTMILNEKLKAYYVNYYDNLFSEVNISAKLLLSHTLVAEGIELIYKFDSTIKAKPLKSWY